MSSAHAVHGAPQHARAPRLGSGSRWEWPFLRHPNPAGCCRIISGDVFRCYAKGAALGVMGVAGGRGGRGSRGGVELRGLVGGFDSARCTVYRMHIVPWVESKHHPAFMTTSSTRLLGLARIRGSGKGQGSGIVGTRSRNQDPSDAMRVPCPVFIAADGYARHQGPTPLS